VQGHWGGCGHLATDTQQDSSACMEQWDGKASSVRLITNKKTLQLCQRVSGPSKEKMESHHIQHYLQRPNALGTALRFGL